MWKCGSLGSSVLSQVSGCRPLGRWLFPGTFTCKWLQEIYFWLTPASFFPFEHVCQSVNFCPSIDCMFSIKWCNTQAFSLPVPTETPLLKQEGSTACPFWLKEEEQLHTQVNFLRLSHSQTLMGALSFSKMDVFWSCQQFDSTWLCLCTYQGSQQIGAVLAKLKETLEFQ